MSIENIRSAQSCTKEARQAVVEFHKAVAQPNTELVVFFCSSEYDLNVLAAEMNRLFAAIQVVGCTTAGEIGPAGYHQHSLSGPRFPASSCVAASGLLDNLGKFEIVQGNDFSQSLLQQLESRAPQAGADIVNNLKQTFDKIQTEIGLLQLTFGCDGILRNLAISQHGLKARIGDIFRHNNTIGFSSYGEQFPGTQVNQTLTGIAIGSPTDSTEGPNDA